MMDDKRIKQADTESLLNNQIFREAIAEYHAMWDDRAAYCDTPKEAFKVVLAKQAANEFISILKRYVDEGIMTTYNEQRENKVSEAKNRKLVR